MLTVSDLEVGYGDIQVVWGISFVVPAGSIVALIGPNGAGKTTTLRAIMGLLPIRNGDVIFEGRPMVGLPTNQIVGAGLVMVPEERSVFRSLSVIENLQLGAFARRARPQMQETMDEVMSIFPRLAERRDQLAGTLSGGERQMLAIGKALMARPATLILDEPSLGLGPLVVERIFEVISEIRNRGLSILLVEQFAELALEIADHAHILEFGRIVVEGPSRELMQDERVRDAYLSL